jgi:hypothetical protein
MNERLANAAISSGTPESGRQPDRGVSPAEIRDRIPGFHTDFTQIDRSGPHTLRHPGQPTNAQMPMKSQKAAHSADFPPHPAGPVIEMPRKFHDGGNTNQHPKGKEKGSGLTRDERKAFDNTRRKLNRQRARDEIEKRGKSE